MCDNEDRVRRMFVAAAQNGHLARQKCHDRGLHLGGTSQAAHDSDEARVRPRPGAAGRVCEIGSRFQQRLGEAFHIRDDRMQAACAGWLRTDEFGNLQVALDVGGADDHLELAFFGWLPAIVPDHPGIRRLRGL